MDAHHLLGYIILVIFRLVCLAEHRLKKLGNFKITKTGYVWSNIYAFSEFSFLNEKNKQTNKKQKKKQICAKCKQRACY